MINLSFKPSEVDAPYHLAVSGGVDSMAMLDFFVRGKHNPKVAFYHHGTDNSDAGMKIVTKYCQDHGLSLVVGNIHDPVVPDGRSAEDYWRECRYEFFNTLETDIYTAHHLDDCVETYVMGLLDGQPKFIPPQRQLDSGYHVFRPMLETPKKELIDWCTRKSVSWHEDESNGDTQYRRNFVRKEIIPKMFETQPGFHKTFLRLMKKHGF